MKKFPSPLMFLHRMFKEDLKSINQPVTLDEPALPNLVRFTIIIFSIATFVFIFWSAIAPVKELVRAEGQVVPSGYARTVQHLEGGLAREILIQEGDFVQRGQMLIRMDGAGTQEDLKEQEAYVQSLMLHEERIKAIIENREPDFSAITTDRLIIEDQRKMLITTLQAKNLERSVIEEQIKTRAASITRLQDDLENAKSSYEVSKEAMNIYKELMSKGHTSKTLFLKGKDEFISRKGEVSSLENRILEAEKDLEEYRQRLNALTASQRDNIYVEFNKVEADLSQAVENLKKRRGRVERLEIRAPVAGYIKGLRINTIGSVIPPGQTLMEIVPIEDNLIVEVKISPSSIGRLEENQTVHVKVDSYDYVRFGTIEGKLTSISAMTFTDEAKREEYYKGKIKLSRNYAGRLPGRHNVIPGMTVDADIVTGEKTVLSYLLKPIRSAVNNSLTEQ